MEILTESTFWYIVLILLFGINALRLTYERVKHESSTTIVDRYPSPYSVLWLFWHPSTGAWGAVLTAVYSMILSSLLAYLFTWVL